MKLTIMQAGENLPDLQPRFGLYPGFIYETFEKAGSPFTYETVKVFEGETPPEPQNLDAVLITGSPAGVYDDLDWLEPLRQFIRRAYDARTPMLGICFGHQIMAHALGADVRKSEKGWGIGRHVYRLIDAPQSFATLAGQAAVIASHQDQVLAPPPMARPFLASDFTPNAGLIYENGAAISVQPHPEFPAAYSEALIARRRGARFAEEHADKAIESLKDPLDRYEVARALAQFLIEAA